MDITGRYLKQLLISSLLGVVIFIMLITPQLRIFVPLLAIGSLIGYIISQRIAIYNQRNIINKVEESFRLQDNIIGNEACSVQYNRGTNLIVTDNYMHSILKENRMFTISKKNTNIESIWIEICENFNKKTTFEDILNICEKKTTVKIILFQKEGAKINTHLTNEVNYFNKAINEQKELEKNYKQKIENNKKNQDVKFIEMNSILADKAEKIDINIATAENLATLPGIKKDLAEKIVNYREQNGKFESIESFFRILEINEDLRISVTNMICVNKNTEK